MLITSLQNPRVLKAARLRESRGRRQQQRIIIDGTREIHRAIDCGIQVDELFVCQNELPPDAQALVEHAKSRSISVLTLAENVFARLAYGDRNEGLIATAERPRTGLDEIPLDPSALICVVDKVEKPGNLGAILRTADGAGASAVLVTDSVCDVFHPNSIRASLGTVFSTPLASVAGEAARDWLHHHSFRILAARLEASRNYADADYSGRIAIVLGSEAKGLDQTLWSGDNVHAIRIPMHGVADSLNVSAAAAVLLYHARR